MKIQQRARILRKNSSPIENLLWMKLRGRRLENYKFRRQQWIGPYVADFYCAQKKLVIELDGPTHGLPSQMRKDPIRQKYLEHVGLKVLRYTNHQILTEMQAVLEDIARHLAVPLTPTLSLGGERE